MEFLGHDVKILVLFMVNDGFDVRTCCCLFFCVCVCVFSGGCFMFFLSSCMSMFDLLEATKGFTKD